jgi:hypothetical protein
VCFVFTNPTRMVPWNSTEFNILSNASLKKGTTAESIRYELKACMNRIREQRLCCQLPRLRPPTQRPARWACQCPLHLQPRPRPADPHTVRIGINDAVHSECCRLGHTWAADGAAHVPARAALSRAEAATARSPPIRPMHQRTPLVRAEAAAAAAAAAEAAAAAA